MHPFFPIFFFISTKPHLPVRKIFRRIGIIIIFCLIFKFSKYFFRFALHYWLLKNTFSVSSKSYYYLFNYHQKIRQIAMIQFGKFDIYENSVRSNVTRKMSEIDIFLIQKNQIYQFDAAVVVLLWDKNFGRGLWYYSLCFIPDYNRSINCDYNLSLCQISSKSF